MKCVCVFSCGSRARRQSTYALPIIAGSAFCCCCLIFVCMHLLILFQFCTVVYVVPVAISFFIYLFIDSSPSFYLPSVLCISLLVCLCVFLFHSLFASNYKSHASTKHTLPRIKKRGKTRR